MGSRHFHLLYGKRSPKTQGLLFRGLYVASGTSISNHINITCSTQLPHEALQKLKMHRIIIWLIRWLKRMIRKWFLRLRLLLKNLGFLEMMRGLVQ